MLIGIDASRANRKNKTGTEWYAYHLIEQFKRMDKTNRYFLYTDKALTGQLAKLPVNWEEKILKWPFKYFWTQGRLSLHMLRNKPDVLFIPSHTIPLINAKKVYTTIHDIGFEHFSELYDKRALWYHRFSIRIAIKRAIKIITISDFTKRDMVNVYGLDPEQIKVIPIGFDNEKFKQLDSTKVAEVCHKYGLKLNNYFLFTGRLEKKKNIVTLLKAFEQFKLANPSSEHKLALSGLTGFGYDEIQATIKNLKAEDVLELGWVSAEDSPYLFAGAFAFLFPSLYEGFGIPPLEAMATGTPVIAANRTSIPEVVGESALLVEPTVESFTAAIEKLVGDQELYRELKQLGLNQVRKYRWEDCARQTLQLLTAE